MLNAADLKTYTAAQVVSLVDVDVHEVRNEVFRRQADAEKRIAKLQKQLAKAQRDMAESATIIEAAFHQMAREAA